MKGAEFGDLVHFESIYVGKKRIEEHKAFAEWVQEMTGEIKPILEPCPSAVQLRTLFLKFVRPDGSGRRGELKYRALISGKRHSKAAAPEDFVKACLSFGYLQDTRWHERIRRVPGDRYNEIVNYVKDWELSSDIIRLLDSLCRGDKCEHIPKHR